MSVTNVVKNCGAMIPEDCSTDVDATCILGITMDCFNRAIADAALQTGVQVGGSPAVPVAKDFEALVPYLAAHNIAHVDRNTLVPAGIALPPGEQSVFPFHAHIRLGTVLRPKGLGALNTELQAYREAMDLDLDLDS